MERRPATPKLPIRAKRVTCLVWAELLATYQGIRRVAHGLVRGVQTSVWAEDSFENQCLELQNFRIKPHQLTTIRKKT